MGSNTSDRGPHGAPPGRGGQPRTSQAPRPSLEIQYHPADIRKGVRYLFLTRRQVVGWSLGSLAYLGFLLLGLWITPTVVGNVLAKKKYDKRVAMRAEEGERLQANVERLGELETEIGRLRIDVSKIYLAYGFSEDASKGKGGYPNEPAAVPRSIHAATIRRGNGLQARIGDELRVLGVFLGEVQSFEEANRDQVRTTPSLSPLASDDFVLTSPYGTRRSPFTQQIDFHAGIDLAAATGTPIYAPADGVVAFAGRVSIRRSVAWWRYGDLVALRNGDRFLTLFGHCEEIRVRTGDQVEQGQVIATVGSTGWSTNPHLHYEIRRKGEGTDWEPVDPRIYILNHEWRDEEELLIRARKAPSSQDYEPLPRVISR
ncbi:MAG: M23 family metallopeptidase [bacterium]|nr:M23 family metallopeptidase [bacterium]